MLLNCAKRPVSKFCLSRPIFELKHDWCRYAAVDEVAVAGAGVVDGVDGFAEFDGPVYGVHCAGLFFASHNNNFVG